MPGPMLVYDEHVVPTLLSLRSAERTRLLHALKQLSSDPEGIEPFHTLTDSTGRTLSVALARPFLITYWLDTPVNELRIVDLQRVRY